MDVIANRHGHTRTFHDFPRLPLELRRHIWCEALPPMPLPTIHWWTRDMWLPKSVAVRQGAHMHTEFDINTMGYMAVDMPTASVNHEAYTIACEWSRKPIEGQELGWELSPFERHMTTIATRRPNPAFDAVFFEADDFDRFLQEPNVRIPQVDLPGEQSVPPGILIRRAAFHATMVEKRGLHITDSLMCFPHLKTLFIIFGDQPRKSDDEHWELEPLGDGTFVFDKERGHFQPHGTWIISQEKAYKIIEGMVEISSAV
ncbi:hypothetical protein ANO11243_076130 [Dothideomycetidae sp. 11243]|nr:hypothetical protein ANO11243_076130 [fungal sp. No.11243]